MRQQCLMKKQESRKTNKFKTTIKVLAIFLGMSGCPGFGQDSVNFPQNPGRGTARWSGPTPTWPNRAGYSVPRAVMLGSSEGGSAAGTHSRLGSVWRRSCSGERLSVSCGSCCVFSLSVSLLFLFPFVCCSVKLSLYRPTSFCLFLSILLRTPTGGGAAAWRFCCRRQSKPKHVGIG